MDVDLSLVRTVSGAGDEDSSAVEPAGTGVDEEAEVSPRFEDDGAGDGLVTGISVSYVVDVEISGAT